MGEWNKHILKDAILQKSLPPKYTFSGCYWMTCSSNKQMDNEKGQYKFYSTGSNTGKGHHLYRKLRKLPATVELKNLAVWRNISKGGKIQWLEYLVYLLKNIFKEFWNPFGVYEMNKW